jgi:hypothetical protein
LKNNNDPRLQSIAIRYKGATSGPDQTVDKGTTLPADQIGMPMGYDNGTIVARLLPMASPAFMITAR